MSLPGLFPSPHVSPMTCGQSLMLTIYLLIIRLRVNYYIIIFQNWWLEEHFMQRKRRPKIFDGSVLLNFQPFNKHHRSRWFRWGIKIIMNRIFNLTNITFSYTGNFFITFFSLRKSETFFRMSLESFRVSGRSTNCKKSSFRMDTGKTPREQVEPSRLTVCMSSFGSNVTWRMTAFWSNCNF